jgi:hypothetical protein
VGLGFSVSLNQACPSLASGFVLGAVFRLGRMVWDPRPSKTGHMPAQPDTGGWLLLFEKTKGGARGYFDEIASPELSTTPSVRPRHPVL